LGRFIQDVFQLLKEKKNKSWCQNRKKGIILLDGRK
jgi:hypothetical protein